MESAHRTGSKDNDVSWNSNFSFEIPKTEVEKLNQILLGIERKQAYKENTDNLVNTTRILSEWRKQNCEN